MDFATATLIASFIGACASIAVALRVFSKSAALWSTKLLLGLLYTVPAFLILLGLFAMAAPEAPIGGIKGIFIPGFILLAISVFLDNRLRAILNRNPPQSN